MALHNCQHALRAHREELLNSKRTLRSTYNSEISAVGCED